MEKLIEAREFFLFLYNYPAKYVCIENPIPLGVAQLGKPTQTIQPYYFGDPYIKTTCLWLRNLPPLVPTDMKRETRWCEPREYRPRRATSKQTPRLADHPNSWMAIHKGQRFAEAGAIRARTFPGIAAAMADQWGNLSRPYGFF